MWRLVCEAVENRENACPGTPHTNGRVPPIKKNNNYKSCTYKKSIKTSPSTTLFI